RQFAGFLGGARASAATGEQVRDFLASLHAQRHPATLGRKLASLRTFFRFAVRAGRCAADPTVGIPAPRTPKRLPRPLAVDDCVTLIERTPAPSRGGPRYDER